MRRRKKKYMTAAQNPPCAKTGWLGPSDSPQWAAVVVKAARAQAGASFGARYAQAKRSASQSLILDSSFHRWPTNHLDPVGTCPQLRHYFSAQAWRKLGASSAQTRPQKSIRGPSGARGRQVIRNIFCRQPIPSFTGVRFAARAQGGASFGARYAQAGCFRPALGPNNIYTQSDRF